MLTSVALKKVQPLALDGEDYRDAEARLAGLLFDESTLHASSLQDLTASQKGTLAAALEMATLNGLLSGRNNFEAKVKAVLVACERELHPGALDLGPKRWNPGRMFDAPRMRQRLRELSHLRAG